LRAAELERRLVAVVPALRVVVDFAALVLAVAGFVLLALALLVRVVVALRGVAELERVAADDEPASSLHLPDNTRWAASATASAISDPSLEALLTMLVAAALALSAASIPASRIARRALGLAAIAAAAAVRPAASISRLIAALASLSRLAFDDNPSLALPFALPLFDDLAMTSLPVE